MQPAFSRFEELFDALKAGKPPFAKMNVPIQYLLPVAMGVLLGQGWNVYSEVVGRGTMLGVGLCSAGVALGLIGACVFCARTRHGPNQKATLRRSLFWMACTLNGGLATIAQVRLRMGGFKANDDALIVNSFLSSGLLGVAMPYIFVRVCCTPEAEVVMPCVLSVLITEASCASESFPWIKFAVSAFLFVIGLHGIAHDNELRDVGETKTQSAEGPRRGDRTDRREDVDDRKLEAFLPATSIEGKKYAPKFLVGRRRSCLPSGVPAVSLISLVERQAASGEDRGGRRGGDRGERGGDRGERGKGRGERSERRSGKGAEEGTRSVDADEVARHQGTVGAAEVGTDIRWDVVFEEMRRVDAAKVPDPSGGNDETAGGSGGPTAASRDQIATVSEVAAAATLADPEKSGGPQTVFADLTAREDAAPEEEPVERNYVPAVDSLDDSLVSTNADWNAQDAAALNLHAAEFVPGMQDAGLGYAADSDGVQASPDEFVLETTAQQRSNTLRVDAPEFQPQFNIVADTGVSTDKADTEDQGEAAKDAEHSTKEEKATGAMPPGAWEGTSYSTSAAPGWNWDDGSGQYAYPGCEYGYQGWEGYSGPFSEVQYGYDMAYGSMAPEELRPSAMEFVPGSWGDANGSQQIGLLGGAPGDSVRADQAGSQRQQRGNAKASGDGADRQTDGRREWKRTGDGAEGRARGEQKNSGLEKAAGRMLKASLPQAEGKGKGKDKDGTKGGKDAAKGGKDSGKGGAKGKGKSFDKDRLANERCWAYIDPNNKPQLGFTSEEMGQWHEAGYFDGELKIALIREEGHQPTRKEFYALKSWWPDGMEPFSFIPKF
eukprot:gnl/MRDRNA2_/MRDRNA2_107886_c0_seq1.p1 gnl/MRDRNA2_/MRDRNA2_107886_c0~~gnl/MRDRNA2_/MRDRNA2_107886_c0_seq1.p1  ORF type:complete len:832 (-),score=173.83 gnl/MRDRNA2_/MRDRNA2_107886_c0_seq1:133-2628(-)